MNQLVMSLPNMREILVQSKAKTHAVLKGVLVPRIQEANLYESEASLAQSHTPTHTASDVAILFLSTLTEWSQDSRSHGKT